MKKRFIICGFLSLVTTTFSQNIIALWNYNTITGAPAAPIADVGTGTSSAVGSMVVANAATGMDPVINNGCGLQNGVNPGAWSFTANPGTTNESSGVQYNVSTLGFQNILFTWDQRWSNTATNTVRVKYTLDGTNWLDFTMTPTNTTFCNGTIDNGRFQNNGVGDQYRRIAINFTSITGANNNANFGIRILAAYYQTTTEFRQTGTPTSIATGGTWRFDNVSFQGLADVSIASVSNFAQYSESIGSINVPVTVANANAAPVNLTFGLSVYSDASENVDYTWTNTLTIPANTNGVTNLPITIINDALAEKAERIIVKILSGVNANISATNNYQIIFIKDNDYVAPTPTNELNLSLLSSYSNGTAGTNSAEIVAFDPSVDRLYIANSIAGKLDIVNFANPAAPVAIASISLANYGGINSVVAHDSIIACAIESVPAQNNGKVVFFDYNGNYINQVEVGAMPDMITFDRNYTKLLTANEGEPDATYANDPVGSVSVIDLTPGYAALTNANVTNIGFTSFNGQEAALRAQGIRIFSTSASVAQDFEPEYIAVSEDNSKAYVTLQENNALVTIDLATNTIVSLSALGYSSYNGASGNAMDASDQSGAVLITGNLPIKGAYMPDAMTYKTINGQGLLFTANEGDSREFGNVIDANRISSATFNSLDATAFPDQPILRNNKFLGRLSALKFSGDTDGDGDYDELHVMGGRSYSIWNAQTGSLVYDSKDLIEQITANHPTFGAIFNASNSTGVPALKNRSDDKGPEPEGVAVSTINGSTYAFVSLERIGGVMMFNVDNPSAPVFVGYANNRSTTISGPDLGAEGIIIISAADSPNGNTLVLLANEVSSTLSIYQINSCAEVSGAPITTNDLTICPNQSTQLAVNNTASVSYEWLLNGNTIPNATGNTYLANQAGNYSVRVTNSSLGCVDTTSAVTVTSLTAPLVSAGINQTVCGGTNVTLSATGASTYTWNNGETTSTLNIQTGTSSATSTFIVTGTDSSTGCAAIDTVEVIVNGLPQINAGSDFSACSNETITLTATGGNSFIWSNTVIDGQPFVLNQTSTFSVSGTDANGCTNTDQITVTIYQAPTVSLGNDIQVCQNEVPVTLFYNVNQAISTASWNSGETSQSIQVNSSGLFSITVSDVNNCSDTDTVLVTLFSLPGADLGSNQSICSNDLPAILSVQSTGNQLSYLWSSGQTTQQIQVSQAGLYSVSVTDVNGCESSDEVQIQVLSSPNVNAGNDITVCDYDFPVTLNATGNGAEVLWSNGSSTPFTSVSQAGTYFVTTTAQNGCSATDSVIVIAESCVSLDDISSNISIYPNPTNASIYVDLNIDEKLDYTVLNSNGQIVLEGKLDTKEISLSEMAKGAYIIRLYNSNVNYFGRIVKQ